MSYQPEQTKRLMTKSEFAEYRGVSKATVSNYGKTGRLVTVTEKGKEVVDVAATVALLDGGGLDPTRGGDRSGKAKRGTVVDFEGATDDRQRLLHARIDRERAQAEKTALEVEREAGRLGYIEEMEAEAFALSRQAQEALMALPDRLASPLSAESDEAACHKMIFEEVTRICRELGGAEGDG